MMIAASGNERGLIAMALRQFEAEHPAVETERAFKVGDLEMDMSYPRAGGNRSRCIGHGAPPKMSSPGSTR